MSLFSRSTGKNTPLNQERKIWIPSEEKLFTRENVILLLIALLMLFSGIWMELTTSRYPDISVFLEDCQIGGRVEACQSAIRDFGQDIHRADKFSWKIFFSEVLKSGGVAIFLAVLISVFIERFSRRRFFGGLSKKTQELAEQVMIGMFNRKHSDSLLETVRNELLEQKIVRTNFNIHYTLSLLKVEDGLTEERTEWLKSKKFIKVDVILSTNMRNVSTIKGKGGDAEVPLKIALPNPLTDELKKYMKVGSFQFNDAPISPELIEEANDKLQSDLKDDSLSDVSVDLGCENVSSGGEVQISATYTMVKEDEDTEVFRTLKIAEAIHLTVSDQTGLGLKVRAKSIGFGKLKRIASKDTTTQWQLGNMILPEQGLLVWWKNPPPALLENS